ncbi:hypothetical protein ACRC7T_03025 [Segnochrobactraceae bacterium EtOH-i3]
MRRITSLYWKNVSADIVDGQRRVFEKLGLSVEQYQAHGLRHGLFMDQMLERAGDDDVLLFVDIDAFPLTREVVERAFACAEAGGVFAVAHAANHLPGAEMPFAGPMFLCVSRRTWDRVGRVSMLEGENTDVGQAFTFALKAHGVPIELLWPNFVCIPRWALGPRAAIGIGTFYGGSEVFHLFESRADQGLNYALIYVADQVSRGVPIDFVALHAHMNAPAMQIRSRILARTLRLRRKIHRIFFGKPKKQALPGS